MSSEYGVKSKGVMSLGVGSISNTCLSLPCPRYSLLRKALGLTAGFRFIIDEIVRPLFT